MQVFLLLNFLHQFCSVGSGDKVVLLFKLKQNFDFAIQTVTFLHLYILIMVYIYACSYISFNPNLIYLNITPLHKYPIITKQLYTISKQSLITCELLYYKHDFCNTVGTLTSINNIFLLIKTNFNNLL